MMTTRNWAGKRVTVLGLSRSGSAVARYVRSQGGEVFLSETSPAAPGNEALREELRQLGVDVEMGGHSQKCYAFANLVVISPGIPPSAEIIEQFRLSGKEIISEVELAYRETDIPLVAITGTNGKSTTTTLISRIFTRAGQKAPACGNIGIPIIGLVAPENPADKPDTLVAELSSFQLEFSPTLRAKVAVFMNFRPDHLDWHGSLEAYQAAKLKLFTGPQSPEWSVVNADDPVSQVIADNTQGRVLWFSTTASRVAGYENRIYLNESGVVTLVLAGQEPLAMFSVRDLQLIGDHNYQNVLASVAAAYLSGVAPEAITEACLAFEGLEHRMERVATLDGVLFYNDSKATNVDAAVCALTAFQERKVVLLAGGKDKMTPLDDLVDAVKTHVSRVVLIGQARERFAQALVAGGFDAVELADSFELGVEAAFRAARQDGNVPVLFSPACASFDMFKNFEERGQVFKSLVQGLKANVQKSAG